MSSTGAILAFGFVTPAFVAAGALLASIPIIIHILNRRRFKTVQWAAMDFLLQAMKKNRRRLRFEHWLLLAIRCCVLAFLGFALARPMGCDQTPLAAAMGRRAGLHVFIIDNSYSMAYEADRPNAKTHLDQAKVLAKGLIDRLSAGGESVAIITAARPAIAVTARPSYDLEGARSAIDRIQQSNGGTDLLGALQKALQMGREESSQPTRNLYLLTDSTRSAWDTPDSPVVLAMGKDLASVFSVTNFNLAKQGQWNQAVLSVSPDVGLVRSDHPTIFQSVVRGYGAENEATLQWKMDDAPHAGGGQIRPALNTQPQQSSQMQISTGGLHVVSMSLVGDNRLKIDDTRWRVVDVASELKVLVVEGERGVGPLQGSGAFLSLALAPPSDGGTHVLQGQIKTNSYVLPEVISDLELGNKVLGDYRAVILTGVSQLSQQEADQLQIFVKQGGALLIFMGEEVNAEAYNQTLLPRNLMPGPLTKRLNMIADPFHFDFNPNGSLHPLLHAFSGLTGTGLDTAATYCYWQVDLPADSRAQRVLDFLPDEKKHRDPAITVHDLGQGRVLFFAGSASPMSSGQLWSSFQAKPAFVALMHELLAGNVSSNDEWLNRTVGQPLEIPPTVQLTGIPTLKDPQQVDVVFDQAQAADGRTVYRSRPLEKPGVYQLATGNRTMPVSVNVPEDEADIRPMDTAAIKQALGGIDMNMLDDALPAPEQIRQPSNDYGWAVMIAVLVLVASECFFAMKFGHYRR